MLASSEVTPTARASSPLFAEAALAELMDASRPDGGGAPALADARALRACLARLRWCVDALDAWAGDASALAPAQRAALAARRDALAEQLHRRLYARCDAWPACAQHAHALRARWAPYAPDDRPDSSARARCAAREPRYPAACRKRTTLLAAPRCRRRRQPGGATGPACAAWTSHRPAPRASDDVPDCKTPCLNGW